MSAVELAAGEAAEEEGMGEVVMLGDGRAAKRARTMGCEAGTTAAVPTGDAVVSAGGTAASIPGANGEAADEAVDRWETEEADRGKEERTGGGWKKEMEQDKVYDRG